jgi:RNA polymerase sigma factor (sigma-70 family)
MHQVPPQLRRLLSPGGHETGEWDAFVAEHSRLLLYVARSVGVSHDDAMDAYVYVLERLREDRCRRLREFANDPRSKLTTWLVVVTRRLCVDHYRNRYGRARGAESARADRQVRRRLQDLIGVGLDFHDDDALVPAPVGADEHLRESELGAALDAAMSTLEPADQLLIRLRFHDDLSAQEIARIMQFPSPFHVYRRVNVLLLQLRRALERRGVESAVP